jgi:hypothetical protein
MRCPPGSTEAVDLPERAEHQPQLPDLGLKRGRRNGGGGQGIGRGRVGAVTGVWEAPALSKVGRKGWRHDGTDKQKTTQWWRGEGRREGEGEEEREATLAAITDRYDCDDLEAAAAGGLDGVAEGPRVAPDRERHEAEAVPSTATAFCSSDIYSCVASLLA